MKKYLKNNDKTTYAVTKMKMQFIEEVPDFLSSHDNFIEYLKKLLNDNFLSEHDKLTDINDINDETDNYKESGELEDFESAIVKNLSTKFENNILFEISSYYEDNSLWHQQILVFFNYFINKILKELNSDFIVNAVFFILDSRLYISLVLYKTCDTSTLQKREKLAKKFGYHEPDEFRRKYNQEKNKDHKSILNEMGVGIEM